jgi:hypothetical protein
MRRVKLSCVVLVALLAVGSSSPAAETSSSVEDLTWLAGCWASIDGELGSGEQWTLPAGGTLFGVGRTVKNSATVSHEFLQIRETGAGDIEYIARPSGQTGATFKLVKLSAGEAIFENLEHDFPQRVIYRLTSSQRLDARIEGEIDGKPRGVDFPMQRTGCQASPVQP